VRILYFTRDYTPHDYRFLTSLAETGHEIFSLRFERKSQGIEDRPLPDAVHQVHWKGGTGPVTWRDFPALWLDLKRVLRSIQPDVLHAGPVPTVAFLAAMSGFHPLVSMSWGSDLLRDIDRDRTQYRAAHYALKKSAVLIGDCRAVQQKAVELGFPAERVVWFPWGIDLTQFSPGAGDALRAQQGWQDAFILLSLRSWEPVYGVDIIARAFVRAARQEPGLRLLLLGSGSRSSQIHEILKEGGIEDRVFYGGQVSNTSLPDYYRAADLYISASHSDGSSVSLMEALACGRPVLVSDIAGNQEWVENNSAGWLFKDGDENALADGILMAYRNRSRLVESGQAARQLAEERADWSQNFQKLLGAYDMAIQIQKPTGNVTQNGQLPVY
jgi:glycosyltransferase involved in cell wall biosynthesis